MAVPKKRHNSSRTRRRRKHNIQTMKMTIQTQECKSCGEQKLPHRVCDSCGTYRGVQYVQKVKKVEV